MQNLAKEEVLMNKKLNASNGIFNDNQESFLKLNSQKNKKNRRVSEVGKDENYQKEYKRSEDKL